VVFGCSYSGALSAWFRLKYPDLVVASVAPSGPVLAQTNFTGYIAQFSRSAAPACVDVVRKASPTASQLMQTQTGISQLIQTFNSCKPLNGSEDQYNFLYNIIDALAGSDQMSNPPDWQLNQTCNTMMTGSNYVQNWATVYNQQNAPGVCNDFSFADTLASLQSTQVPNEMRSWYWQSCVEFGFFQGSYPLSTASVFPYLDVQPQIEWCSQIFGIPDMVPNTVWTNTYYGGYNLQTTNVMFTNGLLDPWHLLSITEDLPSGVQAVTYEAGHCGTMIQATSVDPPSLTHARKKVTKFLEHVLNW